MRDLLKFVYLLKESYAKAVNPVCVKYQLTFAEFDVLLFLANNPEYDTAKDIVEKRYLTKSQVSISIKSLEERKYLSRRYENNNRRTIHLGICSQAENVIQDGRRAQELFYKTALRGFSQEQVEDMKQNIIALNKNMEAYVGGTQ